MTKELLHTLPETAYALIESGTDLSKVFYIQPVGPYRQGNLDLPLFDLIIRRRANLQRYRSTPDLLMDWAAKGGEDLCVHIGKTLEHLQNPVRTFGGLTDITTPLIMGIVNVTPDSFSDGGDFYQTQNAIDHGRQLFEQGADILDVGGESTRPGAKAVALQEELNRVIPVIEGLKPLGAKISIDTRHREVMEAAVKAGADIINDVTALEEEGAVATAAGLGVPVMIMHMQGEPQTMQENPVYENCLLDVYDYLHERIRVCESAGIARDQICIDPGIGFGKTLAHNMEIMNNLSLYQGLGCTVLLGASRKSFIPKICGDVAAKDRLAGSLSAAIKGAEGGVQFVRVHDVSQTKQALDVWEA